MKKILLSLALAFALCTGLCVPASATSTLSGGNAVWRFSNESTGKETVTIQEFSPGIIEEWNGVILNPDVQGSYTSHQETAYTFPIGTTITLQTPGCDYATGTGEPIQHDGVFVERYDRQGRRLDESVYSINFSMTITDSDTIYRLFTGSADGSPTFADLFYVKKKKTSTPPPAVNGFTDVKSTDYFSDAVQWAVEKNITRGTSKTTFSPNVTCTKAQILTFLWHANGSPEPTAANTFTDITPADYFYKAALWAAEKGLVSGSTFGANTDCTRAMTVEYMWKAAGSPAPAGKVDFDDVPANADYAQAVAWAVEKNITSGTGDGNFSPAATCTRGQIVTFLYRAMGK